MLLVTSDRMFETTPPTLQNAASVEEMESHGDVVPVSEDDNMDQSSKTPLRDSWHSIGCSTLFC